MYEKLTKRALINMYLGTGVAMIFCIGTLLIIEFSFILPNHIPVLSILLIILMVICLLNAVISPWFRFHRYRYKIDEECIDIIEGYIFTTREIVPIERLHKLEILKGPFDKICGVAKVNVTTAGGDVTIRFLEEEKAERISKSLLKSINQEALKEKQKQEYEEG